MQTYSSQTFKAKLIHYMDKVGLLYVIQSPYVIQSEGTEQRTNSRCHSITLAIGKDKHGVTFYSDELERMTYADFRNELKLLLPFLFGEINEELDPNANLLLSATEITNGFNVSVFSHGKRLHQQYLDKNQVHDDCSLFMGCASIINRLSSMV